MTQPSAFAQKTLDAKHEKILKELTRAPANRRCADCDNMGPQYVITTYGVFVCTACGGIHRQYGHRVKGISMSRFSKEEIADLKAGGNEKFFANYCATWSSSALPRPTDRNPEHTKTWIESVYVNKRFVGDGIPSEPPLSPIESPAPASQGNGRAGSSVAGSEVEAPSSPTVLRLSDLGGTPLPKLQIGSPTKTLTPRSAVVSPVVSPLSLAGSSPVKKTPIPTPREAPPSPPPAPTPPPAAAAPVAAPEPATNGLAGWDPFGDEGPIVMGSFDSVSAAHSQPSSTTPSVAPSTTPEPTVEPPPPAAAAAAPVVESFGGWAAFGEQPPAAATSVSSFEASASSSHAALESLFAAGAAAGTAPAPAVPVPSFQQQQSEPAAQPQFAGGWAATFGDQPAAVQSEPAVPNGRELSPTGSLPAQGQSPRPQSQPQGAPQQVQEVASFPTAVPAVPQQVQAMPGPARREISLDAFYPEFETIRATGMLPTGKSVVQAQMTQWGVSPYTSMQPPPPQLQNPTTLPPPPLQIPQHSPYSQPQMSPRPGYAAGTPTYPGAGTPSYPNYNAYGGQAPSPYGIPQHQQHYASTPDAGGWPGQQQQQQYLPPQQQYHPQYQQQQYQPPQQQFPGQQYPGGHPGMSTLHSPSAAAPPAGVGNYHLPSPGRASPATYSRPISEAGSVSSVSAAADPFATLAPSFGSALPTSAPTPTGPPPVAAPSSPAFPAAFPEEGIRASPRTGGQTQAASATLFGIETSVTAYDLSAPAAPKPKASGNPFA